MTDTSQPENPKLRLIDTVPVEYEGMRYLMLRDPYRLMEESLFVPEPVIPLLNLMDGTRSPAELRGALVMRYGLMLSQARLDGLLQSLDDALLLDNSRSRRALEAARSAFQQLGVRPPACAGSVYPADPEALTATLQAYLDAAPPPVTVEKPARGIISPHIDYERGGPVYAQVWGQAADAVREAELAIIFGTDHYSEGFPISLTHNSYATPYGVLPTDRQIVDRMYTPKSMEEMIFASDTMRPFAGELHHRYEHSIELAAVWLHFMRGGKPIRLVPVLTGPLEPAGNNPIVRQMLRVLRSEMRKQRTVVIAAGDLAHVGPAFDTPPVDAGYLAQINADDDLLIEAICQGSPRQFLAAAEPMQSTNNICGVSPIYLALRLLAKSDGQPSTGGIARGYAACPADANQTSMVTVCGVTLH